VFDASSPFGGGDASTYYPNFLIDYFPAGTIVSNELGSS